MLKIKKNEPLSKHTTLKIGGPAKYFCVARTIEDLMDSFRFAKSNKLKILILGVGSNILVPDKGFDGLVIAFKGAAGIPLSKLLKYCADKGYAGLEFLAGIPGSLGGAIYMNAGAYGKNISDHVLCVHAIDIKGKKHVFTRKQCKFGYRKSIFQTKKLVITGVEFDLSAGRPKDIKSSMDSIIKKRLSRQPYDLPSAGSFFKNPKGQHAAALIEEAGLKGKRVGDAMISKKHANFIVNVGRATSRDVVQLKELVVNAVYKKYGIKLVPEVIFV